VREVLVGARDVVFRVRLHPRVIQTSVVGTKSSSSRKPRARSRSRSRASAASPPRRS
jgi:hypothetical protein